MGLFRKLFIDKKIHEVEEVVAPSKATEVIEATKKDLETAKKPSPRKQKRGR